MVVWFGFTAYQPCYLMPNPVFTYILNVWSYLPTSPLGQDMTQGQFLSVV